MSHTDGLFYRALFSVFRKGRDWPIPITVRVRNENQGAPAAVCSHRVSDRSELVQRFINELTNEIDGFARQLRRKPQP